jgi:Tfp pilus assembly protein PilO
MASPQLSIKRNLIDKANASIVAAAAAAAFVVVFSMVASAALINQLHYQSHIISGKKDAVAQLKDDIKASNSLVDKYKAFEGQSQNLIGGNPSGNGPQDGDNARIVLDALPSTYDFPALATSLEKVLISQHVQIQSIAGTDDEVAQSKNQSSNKPQAVPMPFQFAVSGDYQSIQNVIKTLGLSIRPMQIQTMNITGDQGNLVLNVTAQTYFQPEKNLKITTQVVTK